MEVSNSTPEIAPDLLQSVREGNEESCRQLVDMLYPVVISIVRRHCPRSEAEEDLCQEIYFKLFSRLHQYAARQPFAHWVSRIALNTCYDRLRRQETRRVRSYADLGTEEGEFLRRAQTLPDSRPPLEGGPTLAREILDKLFTSLKPREEMIIRLLDLEEMSVKEVCDSTGWGASRVRVTAMRARRKLGKTLAQLENNSHAR